MIVRMAMAKKWVCFVRWRYICIEVYNPIEIVLEKNKVMYRYSFYKKNCTTILVSFFKTCTQ